MKLHFIHTLQYSPSGDGGVSETPVERKKKASHGLRGTLKESLLDEHTGAIREDDQTLIKFHGMYQQDDRDRREERAEKKLDRLYTFMIRLRLPELNTERRKELVKVAHKYAEAARVAVRHVRRDGLENLKKMEKDHAISEDEHKRMDTEVQKATDQAIIDIDQLLASKQKEIMTV